ncbi:MAG: ABC transporter substrate-binding protein [Chloroflexi bacterium]|nr:ABC transporter substrate-binding protein [Chloroflexota bacterium]
MSALSRRDLLRLAGFASFAAPGLLAACSLPGPASPGRPRDRTADTTLRIGYLPITDATPLLLAHAQGFFTAEGLDAPRPTLFRSWAQLGEAFQARQVDVVHVLMPMAVAMRFGQQVPLKVVAWNHTDGSAFTVAPRVRSTDDLAGTTIAVPFWYSIHNVVLQLILKQAGLNVILRGEPAANEVKLVVMAPPDMPPALANAAIAGYIVADPFNAVAEVNRVGRIFRFTGDVWLNHACCVVIMHEEDILMRPRWAQAVVNGLVKAQLFARENRREAARLLAKEGGDYLPQPLPVIERALTHYDRTEYIPSGAIKHPDWPNQRIDFQPFPFPSYTEELVKRLKETLVEGDAAFLRQLDATSAHGALVDDRFVRAALADTGEKFGLPTGLARSERVAV